MRTDPFVFHNGRAAHTAADLLQIIEESPLAAFEEHVNKDHNDFAAWVQLGLHEETLAAKLRTTTDRIATISMLRDFVKPKSANPNTQPVGNFAHFLETGHQKEFLWGLLVGLILGIILFRVILVVS